MKKTLEKNSVRKIKKINLALIGMSGAGKSYWSQKMEEKGYRWYNCDEMIAEKLGPKLFGEGKTTQKLAKWMGQPFSEGYVKAEKIYLELEEVVVEQICYELENSLGTNSPVVVDTTGSFIYLKKRLINRLRNLTKMIYLSLPEEKYDQLFENFINDPKPVIWECKFEQLEGESSQNALKRCYKNLLSFRNERYSLLADYVLEHSFHKCPDRDVDEMLDLM